LVVVVVVVVEVIEVVFMVDVEVSVEHAHAVNEWITARR
jgi:hypothetical protein